MKPTVLSTRFPFPLLAFTLPKTQSRPFHHPSSPSCFFKIKRSSLNSLSFQLKYKPSRFRFAVCSLKSSSLGADAKAEANQSQNGSILLEPQSEFNVEVRSAAVPANFPPPKLSLSDQAFFLLAFIACTTSVAFVGLVAVAVPTLFAMGRAAISLSKLADTAREELPSTMAAIRLSGMEISDLTLELSDLRTQMQEEG